MRACHWLTEAQTPQSITISSPNWVCEILSDQTRRIDKVEKMRIYAREGVRNVWHVDPIDIFRLEGRYWILIDPLAGDEKARAEPFEDFELDLALVWAG